jgi:hypothetical protein
LPDWYLDRPDDAPTDEFYLAAFNDLGTERAIGMSMGPIPWSKIVQYAEFAGLEGDVAFAFVAIIRKMDNEYLADVRDDQDAATKKATAASKSNGISRQH